MTHFCCFCRLIRRTTRRLNSPPTIVTNGYPDPDVANVPDHLLSASLDMYRHYLAMILAVDDMLGRLLDYLEQNKLVDNTIVLFASIMAPKAVARSESMVEEKPLQNSIRIPALRYPMLNRA